MLVFWVLLGLFLAFDLLIAGLVVVRGIQSNHWSTVEGTMVSSQLGYVRSGEEEAFSIKVQYSYQVNGVSYVSKRFYFGLHFFNLRPPSWLDAMAVRPDFRTGSACKVYYDPKKPQLSTIVPGFKSYFVLYLLVGGFMLPFTSNQRPLVENLF